MSCPLPLPLPILPSALHADFPPVHIGIKVCVSFVSLHDEMTTLVQPPIHPTTHSPALLHPLLVKLTLFHCSVIPLNPPLPFCLLLNLLHPLIITTYTATPLITAYDDDVCVECVPPNYCTTPGEP